MHADCCWRFPIADDPLICLSVVQNVEIHPDQEVPCKPTCAERILLAVRSHRVAECWLRGSRTRYPRTAKHGGDQAVEMLSTNYLLVETIMSILGPIMPCEPHKTLRLHLTCTGPRAWNVRILARLMQLPSCIAVPQTSPLQSKREESCQ